MAKVISAAEAVGLIRDNAFVFIGGSGGGHAVPETPIEALRDRFAAEGTPRGLTLASSVSIGDWESTGFSLLADPKLVRRVISGGFNNCPKIAALVIADEIEAYTLPQGAISQLCRDMASIDRLRTKNPRRRRKRTLPEPTGIGHQVRR